MGCRGPGVSVTSVLLCWHLQDRTGIYSKIPFALACFHHHSSCCCCPRCEGARLCCCWQRAGVCSHKHLHRQARESACAAVPAAGTDVTGGIPQACWVTSSPSWLLVLNPCYGHPASDRAGLGAGSEPQPQHRHLPGLRWAVQRQPCCCRSSWVCWEHPRSKDSKPHSQQC